MIVFDALIYLEQRINIKIMTNFAEKTSKKHQLSVSRKTFLLETDNNKIITAEKFLPVSNPSRIFEF